MNKIVYIVSTCNYLLREQVYLASLQKNVPNYKPVFRHHFAHLAAPRQNESFGLAFGRGI